MYENLVTTNQLQDNASKQLSAEQAKKYPKLDLLNQLEQHVGSLVNESQLDEPVYLTRPKVLNEINVIGKMDERFL